MISETKEGVKNSEHLSPIHVMKGSINKGEVQETDKKSKGKS